MGSQRIIVTSYPNPDLDGTASAIAYAEFLHQQSSNAVAAVFGTPHREAQFVLKTFHIVEPYSAEKLLTADGRVVLVDASDRLNISSQIVTEQVIEVIDHRKVHEAEKFPRATIQIELVGSCATLIAEKFSKKEVAISQASATLLYAAIISNTVNFQANVTTGRDRTMADWLKEKISVPDDFIHQMFRDKSQMTKPLKEVLDDDLAVFEMARRRVGIAQLEIIEADQLLRSRREELEKALWDIKEERALDYIFLTAIDIELVKNIFLVIDPASEALVARSLAISFQDQMAVKDKITMRKTIVPLIKEALEKGAVTS